MESPISLDGASGHALRSYADLLAGVFTDIFNFSLLRFEVLTCFKNTTIILKPNNNHAACLKDYCLVALTSIIIKCFKRSMADAISLALHSSQEHLDNKDTCNRLLLIDYSSA
eukprot:g25564.t1